MRIGVTYDLRDAYLAQGFSEDETAEFDSIDTIHALEQTLAAIGHEPDCIGDVRALTMRVARGERWDLVFNVAEGLSGPGREAQVPAVLEAYQIPYTFSDPLTLSLALHKGLANRVVRDLQIPTPDYVVVEEIADVDNVRLPWPVFAKPVAEGSSKGVSGASKVSDARALAAICRELLDKYRQPVLVERFLPGREFTAGIVGAGPEAAVLGVMEIHLHDNAEPAAYSRANKALYESRVSYTLVEDSAGTAAADVALAAWRALGCRDAGRVDLRCDADGAVHFLEVNPLPGLHPRHSDLVILCRLKGIAYRDLIETIVSSARVRSERARARASGAMTRN